MLAMKKRKTKFGDSSTLVRINLTPPEELHNSRWWVGDVTVALTVLALSYGGVMYLMEFQKDAIAKMEEDAARYKKELELLTDEVSRTDDIITKLAALQVKAGALTEITSSKLKRYFPIILLELVQVLKPNGVWLESMSIAEEKAMPAPSTPEAENKAAPEKRGLNIEIKGFAHDNLKVSEFMFALKSSQHNRYEKADLRTQLFFDKIDLNFTELEMKEVALGTKNPTRFKMVLTPQERSEDEPKNDDREKNPKPLSRAEIELNEKF